MLCADFRPDAEGRSGAYAAVVRVRVALAMVGVMAGVAACSGGGGTSAARHPAATQPPSTVRDAAATAAPPTTTTTTYPFSYAPVATHPEVFRGFGKLAYVSGGQLFVLDGTGSPARAVGNGVEIAKIRWSPDGRWLAYEPQTPNGGGGVFVVRADGSAAPVKVTDGSMQWDWSPTEDVLAVVGPDTSPNAYGGTIQLLRPDRPDAPIATVNPPYLAAYGLSWAPDGRTLAFSVANHGPQQASIDHLFAVEVGCGGECTSRLREIPVNLPTNNVDNGLEFAGWTADSRRAFVWLDDYHSGSSLLDGLALASVSLDGGGDAVLPATLAKPSWVAPVPGHDEVLLDAGHGRTWDQARVLIRCPLASADCSPLVVGNGPTLDPAVSPGGTRLASVATDPGVLGDETHQPPASSVAWNQSRRLVISALDGTGARTVASGGVIAPRWAADGRHLVFARAGYLWLVDADTGTQTAIAGPLDSITAYNSNDPYNTPFEENAYLFPGDDVWDQAAWLHSPPSAFGRRSTS